MTITSIPSDSGWKWQRRLDLYIALLVGLFVAACAQVPKESVELSVTVGRDIVSVHKAHRELAQLVFERMRRDINRFVDTIYAPFQVRNVMESDNRLARSQNPEDRKKSLLLGINAAFSPDASAKFQESVLKGMGIMVGKIHKDVESMRNELLTPLNAQEKEVLGSIDRAYHQLHYANSIVTGHLSSVVKVHETQDELLREFGVKRDLRKEVSENLAKASDKIGALVGAAEAADDKLDEAEANARKLKDAIRELEVKLGGQH